MSGNKILAAAPREWEPVGKCSHSAECPNTLTRSIGGGQRICWLHGMAFLPASMLPRT